MESPNVERILLKLPRPSRLILFQTQF